MKKEVLIAIVIGFILGLLITFGIWAANKSLKELKEGTQKPQEVVLEITPTPTPTLPEEKISLTITSPEDNSINSQEKIEIVGETTPEAVVTILYQEGEKILEADENGAFSTEITLVGGANEIQITAYNSQGNEARKTLNVVYSTAEI